MPEIYSILLVDKNSSLMKDLRNILDPEEFHIVHVKNIKQVISNIKFNAPDLLLIPLHKPTTEIFNLYIDIKNISHDSIPALFIGKFTDDILTKVIKFGNVDFIQLPLIKCEVILRIKNHIKETRYKRSLEEYNITLQKRCKRFEDINQNIADLIWETDKNGNLNYISENIFDILGYTPKELLGKTPYITLEKKAVHDYKKRIVSSSEIMTNFENWHIHKNGNFVCFLSTIVPIYDEEENILGYRGFNNDITEKKLVQKKILKLNEKLEESVYLRTKELEDEKYFISYIINSLPGIFYTFDNRGFIQRSNKNFQDLLGLNESEIKKINILQTFLDIEGSEMKTILKELDKINSISFEGNITTMSGNKKPYLLTCSKIIINKTEYIVGVGIDLTEEKKAETQLKRLSEAVEQSPVSIVITDIRANIIYVNKAFSEISGYNEKEIIGKNCSILNSGTLDKEFFRNLWDTILSGKTWKGELYNKKKNGEIYCELSTISPIFDKKGEIGSFVAIKDDITGRKERERNIKNKASRHERQSTYLLELTQKEDLTEKKLKEAYDTITKYTVLGLNINRASIWVFEDNKKSLRCLSLYNGKICDIDNVAVITSKEYPVYFEKLLKNKPIVDIDETNDKRINELNSGYLEVDQVLSILDIPVWLRGDIFGVLCTESHTKRDWNTDEISFARSLSDFVSLTVEANDRKIAQKKAEQATKAKSDFIANMSHEIRTPMNAIVGLLHLISRTKLDDKQENYIRKINSASSNLLAIINDILDFSKIEAGKFELEHVDFNLDEVVDNIFNMMHTKAESKGLELILIMADDLPKNLNGDPLRIGQILLNLVSNAIKFTEYGKITIKCEIDCVVEPTVSLKFSVTDTGIGLTEAQSKKLFKSFSQADTSTTRKYGGTGLGLSISKKLTELMGGRIGVNSVYKKGSTFSFTFKCKKNDSYVLKDLFIPEEFKDMRILVVANDDRNREILLKYLENYEFDILAVSSAYEAISIFLLNNGPDSNPFKFIFIDLFMPKLNGLDAIRKIKKIENVHQPKAVLMCDYSREDVLNECNRIGFDSIMLKPITSTSLDDTISSVLGYEKSKIKSDNDLFEPVQKKIFTDGDIVKILVVEDNEINQQVIIEIIEQDNIIIDLAVNGYEAIDMINNNKYNLVLMDLQMPILDGVSATKIIRKTISKEQLPIIALTGNAVSGVKDEVISCGMNDYITKPINIKDMFKTINKWIDIKRNITHSDEISDIPEIKYLNCREGILRLNNNVEAYLDLVTKFKNSNITTFSKINNLFINGKYNECCALIHSLKGISGNLSAISLFNSCINLEESIVKRDIVQSYHLINDLEYEIKNLFGSISSFLETRGVKTKKIETKEIIFNKDLFNRDIIKLESYLRSNNVESKKLLESLLIQVSDDKLKDNLNNIMKHIENFDFEKSLEIIENIKVG